MRQPSAARRRGAELGAPASPPTGRVLDVVELLARRADRALTLTDMVRELGITYATAHAILATLAGRGWVQRDAGDKSYTLGPALALAARQAERADSRDRLARTTAAELVRELGCSTSVTQIVAGAVVITGFYAPEGVDLRAHPGDRVPLTAPFGGGFVAWEPAAVRRAWIERADITDPSVQERLEAALMAIRQRGFAVERMRSSARQVLDLAKDLHAGVVSDAMRESIERLLAEITSASHLPDDLHDSPKGYVSAITAPVFDRSGKAALNVGVHPFRALSGRRIEQIGRALVRATDRISGRPAADRDDTHSTHCRRAPVRTRRAGQLPADAS